MPSQEPSHSVRAAHRDAGGEAIRLVCAALALAMAVLAWRITSTLL